MPTRNKRVNKFFFQVRPGGVSIHKLLYKKGGKGIRSCCGNRLADKIVHDPTIVKFSLGVQGAEKFQELDE